MFFFNQHSFYLDKVLLLWRKIGWEESSRIVRLIDF